MQRNEVVWLWKIAIDKTGLNIAPQKLRQWFCLEAYVDTFCGRVQDIYEKASSPNHS